MAEKPVPARELSHLHARISRDVGDLRSRWGQWAKARRGATGSTGAAGPFGANPEDIVGFAFRTFRAMRLLLDAFGGAQTRQ